MSDKHIHLGFALLDTLKHSLVITSFILGMMLLIEYLIVQTKFDFAQKLRQKPGLQIILASVLGIIPGCLGTFFTVTLYSHNLIGFPALVSVMIATSGDEAYVMLAQIPDKFITINLILFSTAIITGYLLLPFYKTKMPKLPKHLQYHGPSCYCFDRKEFVEHFKNLSFQRAILITVLTLLVIFEATGQIGPEKWYFRYTLLGMFVFGLFIVVTVPEHFLEEHIWQHIVKQHIPRIFFWTFLILLVLKVLLPYLDLSAEEINRWAGEHYWLLLTIAVFLGLIPESGPHMLFIFMYAQGMIPLSILIANSISQDGHGSLPLLAESGKSFIQMKIINILVAFVVGSIMYLIGL